MNRRFGAACIATAWLAGTGCSGVLFQPRTTVRTGMDKVRGQLASAQFSVSCDRCRVEYGQEDNTLHEETQGSWTGEAWLGTIQTGESVRVVLRVRPVGDAAVLSAIIALDGRIVASAENGEPGKAVTLRTTVRGPDPD